MGWIGMDVQPIEQGGGRRTRGRPTLEDAELIDSALLDGALRVFLDHGYGGTSVGQIVKSLGISKTTFYSRYPSKADLFRAIISRQIDGLAAEAALETPEGLLSLEAGLRAYAEHSLAISLEGDLLQINRLIYSESHRFPELGAAAAERTRLGVRQISDFIAQCAVRDGVPCRNAEAIAEAFIFMLRGWYVNVMLINEAVGPAARRRFADQAVRALLASREQW